ncbi:MAG: GGDEF domain-containing protein [Ruminococcus sp.]|nr:GGDEF domain-containing protein [Ruminococcus sp.]
MNKYKIAVIIASIDQSYQSSILNGIEEAAAEYSMDIFVFVSFIGTLGNPGHDTGEFNIFSLPDFSEFDGAVLLTNTIDHPPVVRNIFARIRQAGIPAVSIDNDVPDMFHIGIDNDTAMRRITEHFIKVHNVKKFNYISGPRYNPESSDRLCAFFNVLEENHIEIESDRIYYGDFRAPSGKNAVEYFLKRNPSMPEAIICANDVMAATAINRLSAAGYKIPSEIKVSGFDDTYSKHNYQMELTSVERPLKKSGRLACKMLYEYFTGQNPQRSIILDMSPKFRESCGCCDNEPFDIQEFKTVNYTNYRKYENINAYMSVVNKLSCDLQDCGSFRQYIASFKKFVADMNPEEFYFCLCENWDSEVFDEKNDLSNNNKNVPSEFTENVIVEIAYSNGVFHDKTVMKTRELIPECARSSDAGKMYYFIPLHFGERCLGFMAIRMTKLPLHNSMFQSWCITISNSLENMRKLICLDLAVQRLGRLYTKDTFTGILNRNGFVQATTDIYNACVSEKREIMLMFIDLDGLKVINDTYGHDVGDEAICAIADILTVSCKNNEVFCRFGGDEFIIFAADYNDDDAKRLTEIIKENIEKKNSTEDKAYKLSASTGYVIVTPTEKNDIFRFVTEADKIMYKEKRRKKRSKYLKS